MSKLPEATLEQRETLHQKAIGKHIETKTEYEVSLRYGDEEGQFYVDVREDIATLDDEPVTQEYIEGFVCDTYDEAKKTYLEMQTQVQELDGEMFLWNEVEDEEKQYDLELQCAGDTGFSVRLKTQSEYIERFVYGGQGTCMEENYTKALKKFRKIKEEYAEKGIIVNQIKSDYDRD